MVPVPAITSRIISAPFDARFSVLTAVGILRLVEWRKLDLSQPVFGLMGTLYYLDPFWTSFNFQKTALGNVTVREMRAGQPTIPTANGTSRFVICWSTRVEPGRMDPPTPCGTTATSATSSGPNGSSSAHSSLPSHIQRCSTSRDYPLLYAAGTAFMPSDFGYHLLGLIIEQVSGMPYEQFTQRVVLHPIGVTSAVLSRRDKQRLSRFLSPLLERQGE